VLTAILVVAIATVLAVNLLWQTSVGLTRTENLLLQDQARQYDLGGEEFAKFGLAEDARDDGPDGTDTTLENWAKPLAFEVEAGTLEGYLQDQQGRFNLNGLISKDGKRVPKSAEQFERLLQLLPLDSSTAAALTDATIDWIDPNSDVEINGAEDDQYTSRQPPYRPGNFWLTSTSELLAIEGYTNDIYAALQPHVTALPPRTDGAPHPLNVNTATPLVLASLLPNLSPLDVEPFVGGAYEKVADFEEDFPGEELIGATIPLDVHSDWFLLTVTASIGTARSTMYSLLERTNDAVRTRLRTFDAN
jgi:general secretion pathway protein K